MTKPECQPFLASVMSEGKDVGRVSEQEVV